jgi:hypothetical protein
MHNIRTIAVAQQSLLATSSNPSTSCKASTNKDLQRMDVDGSCAAIRFADLHAHVGAKIVIFYALHPRGLDFILFSYHFMSGNTLILDVRHDAKDTGNVNIPFIVISDESM